MTCTLSPFKEKHCRVGIHSYSNYNASPPFILVLLSGFFLLGDSSHEVFNFVDELPTLFSFLLPDSSLHNIRANPP